MRPVYIYAIHVANTDKVIYVGKTVNPEMRFKEHRCRWRPVEMRIVETLPDATSPDVAEAEKRWIAHYAELGHRLRNRQYLAYEYREISMIWKDAEAERLKRGEEER